MVRRNRKPTFEPLFGLSHLDKQIGIGGFVFEIAADLLQLFRTGNTGVEMNPLTLHQCRWGRVFDSDIRNKPGIRGGW